MSEAFTWDVAYSTTFEQIEQLRSKMLAFVKSERRDFLPSFDIVVVDIPDQEKMTLKADIKYKSNWQQGALKVKRRNMWICALKASLQELKIFGPSGNPDKEPGPKKITMVPWGDSEKPKTKQASPSQLQEPTIPRGDWQFADRNALILDSTQDVFGETEDLYRTNPTSNLTEPAGRGQRTGGAAPLYSEHSHPQTVVTSPSEV